MASMDETVRATAGALRAKADEIERAFADTLIVELPWPNRPDRTVVLTKEMREEPRADVNKLIAEAAVMLSDLKPIPVTVEIVADPKPIEPAPIEPAPIEPV